MSNAWNLFINNILDLVGCGMDQRRRRQNAWALPDPSQSNGTAERPDSNADSAADILAAPTSPSYASHSSALPQQRERALHAQTLGRAAIAENEAGNVHGALTLFMKAVELDPLTPNYLLSAGNMHLRLDAPANAIQMYERCHM